MNTVIQGTAADLIKRAMVGVRDAMARQKLSANMILQVHDELVFEVTDQELAPISKLLKSQMESAMELRVPLVVDLGNGDNWRQAH